MSWQAPTSRRLDTQRCCRRCPPEVNLWSIIQWHRAAVVLLLMPLQLLMKAPSGDGRGRGPSTDRATDTG